jgi:hypothetical protein
VEARRTFAALLAWGILIALAGSAFAHRAAQSTHAVPGIPGNYASTTVVQAGLSLPIPFVEYHVASGWIPIAIALSTVCALAAIGRRLALLAASLPRPALAFVTAQAVLGLTVATFAVTLNPDAFAYMLYGRLFGVYHINPYDLQRIVAYPHDFVVTAGLQLWGIPPWNDVYGPAWTLAVSTLERALGATPLALHLVAQRLLAVAAAVAASAALLFVLRARPCRERLQRVGAFAFNPLVLLETAINGHNDMIMVALVMWAFALAEESLLAAVVLFALSVAVKWVSIVLLPFLVVRLARTHGRAAVLAPLVALALPALALVPFWVGPATLRAIAAHATVVERSPAALLGYPFVLAGVEDAPAYQLPLHVPFAQVSWQRAIVVVLFLAFAAFAVAAFVRYLRKPRCRDIFAVVLAFLVATPFLAPYYLIWISPMLAAPGRWARYARWFTLLALLYYAVVSIPSIDPTSPIMYAYTALYWIVPAAAAGISAIRSPGLRGSYA